MRPDIIDLRDFYNSRLGQLAHHLIRLRIRAIWPSVAGLNVLGLGYATPYLTAMREEAQRVIALMPAPQGVAHWPRDGRSLVALADEQELPLPDACMERVLLVHGLEHAEQVRPLLREVWRVMTSSGRLIVVAPNRRGIWCRIDRTPFGHGLPYSGGQLSRLLRENMFQPTQRQAALYMPPFRGRMLLGSAGAWERVGARFAPHFAGALIVEADKQVYAVSAAQRRRRQPRVVPIPVAQGRSPMD